MMVNLQGVDIPLGMISQYLPKQFERIQSGELSAIPHQLIWIKFMMFCAPIATAVRNKDGI
ncbi:putative tagatose 6-phosphate kinase [Escherichia coli]|nr:putative tagatose 6-phosphate kinase [Escherichia coli]